MCQHQVDVCIHDSVVSQIITSCIFAMVQRACGEKADEDPDFAFELETFKFRTPTVRFSYE